MIVVNARFLTQKTTGVQRFAIEISKHLKRILPQVIFVTPYDIIDTALANELNVTITGTNKGVVWEQIDLPRYLAKNGSPLLINLANVAPLFYSNQIVTIHDLAFKVNPAWFNKKFVWFYNFLIPRIAKKARKVFTVSNFSKQEIISHLQIEAQKIAVIYNSITDFPAEENKGNKYGNYLLTVGSIDKRKNISSIFTAIDHLKDKSIKLLVAGDYNPIFNNKNNDSLKNSSQITFLGRVNDAELRNLYQNAMLFIYPSLYEGFGIPPLEAMFYNCPTIVSDIGSLREVCADASLYIDPNSAEDIAKKIENLLNDFALRNALIEKGKLNIKKYSWEKSATLIAETIEQLK